MTREVRNLEIPCSLIHGVINGQSTGDIGRNVALSFGLGAAQNAAGDIGQKFNMEDGSLGKAALHGLVGATYAELAGGSARAGFISGAASEIVSSYLSHPGTTTSHPGLDPGSPEARGMLREIPGHARNDTFSGAGRDSRHHV